MIRFIITHTAYNGNPEGCYERRVQTLDADVPELEAVLRSGGRDLRDGRFERADVVGYEVRESSTRNERPMNRVEEIEQLTEQQRLIERRLRELETGCRRRIAPDQWLVECGDVTEMGGPRGYCAECGGEYRLADSRDAAP